MQKHIDAQVSSRTDRQDHQPTECMNKSSTIGNRYSRGLSDMNLLEFYFTIFIAGSTQSLHSLWKCVLGFRFMLFFCNWYRLWTQNTVQSALTKLRWPYFSWLHSQHCRLLLFFLYIVCCLRKVVLRLQLCGFVAASPVGFEVCELIRWLTALHS